MKLTEEELEKLKLDMLYGADEIARYVGISRAQVYHAARLKRLPIGKWGHKLVGSKREIARALAKMTVTPLIVP